MGPERCAPKAQLAEASCPRLCQSFAQRWYRAEERLRAAPAPHTAQGWGALHSVPISLLTATFTLPVWHLNPTGSHRIHLWAFSRTSPGFSPCLDSSTDPIPDVLDSLTEAKQTEFVWNLCHPNCRTQHYSSLQPCMSKVRKWYGLISHHLWREKEKVLGCWKSTAELEKRGRCPFFYGRKALPKQPKERWGTASLHPTNSLLHPGILKNKSQFQEGHRSRKMLLGNLSGFSRPSNCSMTMIEGVNRDWNCFIK